MPPQLLGPDGQTPITQPEIPDQPMFSVLVNSDPVSKLGTVLLKIRMPHDAHYLTPAEAVHLGIRLIQEAMNAQVLPVMLGLMVENGLDLHESNQALSELIAISRQRHLAFDQARMEAKMRQQHAPPDPGTN